MNKRTCLIQLLGDETRGVVPAKTILDQLTASGPTASKTDQDQPTPDINIHGCDEALWSFDRHQITDPCISQHGEKITMHYRGKVTDSKAITQGIAPAERVSSQKVTQL